MQALYSGFSYIGSEARRATKPIVETLAPIVPTFGCGEAAVKQSISSCIHEMEAVSIEDVHVAKNGMGSNDSFMNIKKIVLYPFHHPEAKFGVSSKCHTSTEAELGILANVTSNINQQLESWSIPFRFEVSKDRKHINEFLTTKKTIVLPIHRKKKISHYFLVTVMIFSAMANPLSVPKRDAMLDF